jgi:hypothetical protein
MNSVDLYAVDIVKTAERVVHGRKFESNKHYLLMGAISSVSIYLTSDFFGNPLYHLSGLACALVDRALDTYSTLKAIRLLDDGKFFEYGLGDFYYEENPIYRKFGELPTTKQYFGKRKIIKDAFAIVLATAVPPFGHGMLSQPYFIYTNNSTIAREVKTAIDIGDQVKKKIEAHVPDQMIREWLRNYNPDSK